MRTYFEISVRALSIVGALLLAAPPAVHAQVDNSAAIAALEERIKVLEDKLAEIEQAGTKIKAPFSVVNSSGESIFHVLSAGGSGAIVLVGGESDSAGAKILLESGTSTSAGGAITVMGSGSSDFAFQAGEIGGKATAIVGNKEGAHALMQSDGSMTEVTVSQGEGRQVAMKLDGESTMVKAENNGNDVTLGDNGGTIGVVLNIGGNPAAELSKWPDRQFPSVRIYGASSGIVAGLGTDITNPSNGLLTVFSNGDANGVIVKGDGTIEVRRDGAARMKLDAEKQTIVMNGAVEEAIKLDAREQSIVMNGTVKETIKLDAIKQTINVKGSGNLAMLIDGAKGVSATNGEKKLATVGFNSAGNSGQLWVFSSGGAPAFSATAEGNSGVVIVGDESLPHIKMSTENGQAEIAAEGGGENSIAMLAAQGLAHLRADTSGFAVSLGKLDGQVGMIIEQGNKLMAEFSKPNDRNSASLRVYGSSSNIVAGLGGQSDDPETGLIIAKGPGGGQAMMTGVGWMGLSTGDNLKVVASAEDKVIALYGDGSEYIVTLSPGSSGGGNITTYDKGGTGVFSAGATQDGGTACIVHKGKLTCLGIGLPLMGGGSN